MEGIKCKPCILWVMGLGVRGDNFMWFQIPGLQILESTESKIAFPVGIGLIILYFVLSNVVSNAFVLDIINPIIALLLGCAIGWALGEAFLHASGVWKVILGGISVIFGASVTFSVFRERVELIREKVIYILALLPISNQRSVNAIALFIVGFFVGFIFSVGLNYTRMKERLEQQLAQSQPP
jgi:hypothetical protein